MQRDGAAMTAALLLAVGSTAVYAASAAAFGPSDCVSIERSAEGSCVLRTSCAGRDISHFNFSFDCLALPHTSITHALGVGSFDEDEEYDTDIKCDKCLPPGAKNVTGAANTSAGSHPSSKGAAGRAESPRAFVQQSVKQVRAAVSLRGKTAQSSEAVSSNSGAPLLPKHGVTAEKYGPHSCIATWRDNETGHCMMQTDCDQVDISSYNFGFLCEGSDEFGEETSRHLFGQGTFKHQETFDTSISCKRCLGLAEQPQISAESFLALQQQVEALKGQVSSMAATISELSKKSLIGVPQTSKPTGQVKHQAQPTRLLASVHGGDRDDDDRAVGASDVRSNTAMDDEDEETSPITGGRIARRAPLAQDASDFGEGAEGDEEDGRQDERDDDEDLH